MTTGERSEHLRFLGADAHWPLTSSVGLYRAPVNKVLSAVAGRSARRLAFGSLDEAVTSTGAEFTLPRDLAAFVAPAAGGEWTAVFVSSFPNTDVGGYYFARAERDVKCDYVSFDWTPASGATVAESARVLPSASFSDYRAPGRLSRGSTRDRHRTIQVTDQGGSWTFDALGPVREYEDPTAYTARRKADRLPLDLIEDYLTAVGVPVDDSGWLDGPVTAVVQPGLGVAYPHWTSIAGLRRACGYPASGIPGRLTGWKDPS